MKGGSFGSSKRGGSAKKAGPKKPTIPGLKPPQPPRRITKRALLRQAYRSAGALDSLPKLRNTPTDLERLLKAAHISERIAKNLSVREQQEFENDLSALGIKAGRTAGTMPELAVGHWLLQNGYPYGGTSYSYNGKGFGFQVPLVGGRGGSGGGTVADWFLGPDISHTDMGVAVFVDGLYWHNQPDQIVADTARRLKAKAQGYEVTVITDVEALKHGTLNDRMQKIFNGYYD
jgi:hypothetical protein